MKGNSLDGRKMVVLFLAMALTSSVLPMAFSSLSASLELSKDEYEPGEGADSSLIVLLLAGMVFLAAIIFLKKRSN